ncbi:prolipoprotein diacylglyceryl transferase [Acetobacterium paludosum]|uniref:Phosphatidylglycerol--prolipoprotein diacylglyceryl transferase n=1 Tax=Acetobacterium paludosum TaxID=52693 RepID=A0A923KR90_9FIRM|nr:prolipoprotein diacylglyceryl transferase [Acetobacterium paludosum]MBC3887002.1 prolipoprotein diacylglyceryl transferase [Acetobacterium paludosum]
MNPVAFYIFGVSIRWYGLFIASGMILGLIFAKYNCKYRNINFDSFLDVILISLPIGIIGARLYYVIFQFNDYKDNLIDIFNIRQGGLAIHGGILFAFIAAYIVTNYKKIDFLKIADVAAPSIIIAQALGRWGNFFNGEAHGGIVSYEFIKYFPLFIQNGMYIDGLFYQPTFLYESIWDLSIFLILMLIIRKYKRSGIVFFTYIGLYSLGRFFIEGLRTDSLMLGSIRIAQLMSLSGVMIWVAFLIFLKYKKTDDHLL